MTLHELCCIDGDAKFRIGNSKIVWEFASCTPSGWIIVSRVINANEKGGKPFFMDLKYKSRYANPHSIVSLIK